MQKINGSMMKFKLYNLVAAALFTALSVALTPLNVYIPLFGVSSLRFSVNDIPVFLCGTLLGPALGMICGGLSDILGFAIAPAGPYFFGFTISKMLIGFIPGMLFYFLKNNPSISQSTIKKINKGLAALALIGALYYINFFAAEEVQKLGTIGGLKMNLVISFFMVGTVALLVLIVKKMSMVFAGREGLYKLQTVILAVSLNYVVVALILSPIWLYALYNVPAAASVIARVFKSLIDVPLQVGICYTVLQAIPMKVRQKIAC